MGSTPGVRLAYSSFVAPASSSNESPDLLTFSLRTASFFSEPHTDDPIENQPRFPIHYQLPSPLVIPPFYDLTPVLNPLNTTFFPKDISNSFIHFIANLARWLCHLLRII
jgi:hypothetical protein